jgi:hypothetical protein
MRRYRFGVLVLLLLSFTATHCSDDDNPATKTSTNIGTNTTALSSTSSPAPAEAPSKHKKYKFKDGKTKVIVTDTLTTEDVRKRACAEAKAGKGLPPPSPEEVGGFACTTIWLITLSVESGQLTVSDEELPVEIGECVMWQVSPADGKTLIKEINFIDNQAQADASVPKKAVPPKQVPSICNAMTKECVLGVALPKGKYSYAVTVNHDRVDYTKDPDLNVACGSHCDESGVYTSGGG